MENTNALTDAQLIERLRDLGIRSANLAADRIERTTITDKEVVSVLDTETIARTFYEWGIGRGNDFGWEDVPTSIRDRCFHAADACKRALLSHLSRDTDRG